MPAPERLAVAPATKFVPVNTMSCALAPWPRADGAADVSVGNALTVKQPVHVAAGDPSPLPTEMSRASTDALPSIDTVSVICVGESTVVAVTMMPAPENDAVAPEAKFVPISV